MKTVIIAMAEKLPENMAALKEHMTKQDFLYILTESGTAPVSCFRDLNSIPCRTDFLTVPEENRMNVIHLLVGLSGKSCDGVYVVGLPGIGKDLKLCVPEGIEIPAVKTGMTCNSLFTAKETSKAPVKRTRRKKAETAGTEKKGKEISKEQETGDIPDNVETDENPGTVENGADIIPMDSGDMNEPELVLDEASEEKPDITHFSELLYAYCGKAADINGREEEIATAVGKCMSDVSLDMMLRMYVQPEIPGLFDVLSQHYKELKAALE